MAMFEVKLPTEIIDEINKIEKNCINIFGKMTRAGANLVYKNLEKNLPGPIRTSSMRKNMYISKTYISPSDGAINTKVGFAKKFYNKKEKLIPAPLVANLFEYGRHDGKYPKCPFFRRSFVKNDIENEMFKEQEKLSGGLLTKWTTLLKLSLIISRLTGF